MFLTKKGREFEEFVNYVFSALLKLEESNIVVTQNAYIRGRSGAKHEFDVYYEFDKARIIHRVAIECKDEAARTSKGHIIEFAGKIEDVDHLIGVVVSRNGYQKGAMLWAKHHGITLLTPKDLPSINKILAMQIKYTLLPDDNVMGQPFWTVMEVANGEVNGNYTCVPGRNRTKGIPLFFSKRHAELFLQKLDPNKSVVRGVHQQHLKELITLVDHFEDVSFVLFSHEVDHEKNEWLGFHIEPDSLRQDYLLTN